MICEASFIGAQPTRSGKWAIYLGDTNQWGFVPGCTCWSDSEPTYSVGQLVRVAVDCRNNKTFVRLADEERR